MAKYTDEAIRKLPKITCKIAADYLGIAPMAVSIGMRNDLLPIGFAIQNEDRYSDSWSYQIIAERMIAYSYLSLFSFNADKYYYGHIKQYNLHYGIGGNTCNTY